VTSPRNEHSSEMKEVGTVLAMVVLAAVLIAMLVAVSGGPKGRMEEFAGHAPWSSFTDATIEFGPGNRVVDCRGGTCKQGANLHIWDPHGGPNQSWTYDPRHKTVKSQGACMDVSRAGRSNGTNVQAWSCNGSKAQRWILQPNKGPGQGSVQLMNPNSGKCLDVSGAVDRQGQNLQIWDCRRSGHSWDIRRRTSVGTTIPQALQVSLSATAVDLLRTANMSVSGIASVSSDLSFSTFHESFYLNVVQVDGSFVRFRNADALVARGSFVAPHFKLIASYKDVIKSKSFRNIQIFRVEPPKEFPGTQVLAVEHASKSAYVDLSLWAGARSPPTQFEGMRLGYDPRAHVMHLVDQETPSFRTPDVLKRKILAGVTMFVPGDRKALVAFRRYRESSGYILFLVQTTARDVTIKHIIFRRNQRPNDLNNAVASLEWNEAGEFDVASFQSTPRELGAVSNVETLTVDEACSAMDVATSITIPLKRRDATVVEVTPGRVRVTSHPVGDNAESRVVAAAPFMAGNRDRWLPNPSRPLQMYVRNAVCFPVPAGDHIHLSDTLRGQRA